MKTMFSVYSYDALFPLETSLKRGQAIVTSIKFSRFQCFKQLLSHLSHSCVLKSHKSFITVVFLPPSALLTESTTPI